MERETVMRGWGASCVVVRLVEARWMRWRSCRLVRRGRSGRERCKRTRLGRRTRRSSAGKAERICPDSGEDCDARVSWLTAMLSEGESKSHENAETPGN